MNNFSKELFIPIIDNIKFKKFDEALILLNNLSDQNPNIINRFKGSIYLSKKDWKKSLFYYQKMSDTEKNFKILNNMGFALFKLGKYSEASQKFKQSLDYNNGFIAAYENLIISLKLTGNYELSIKYILLVMDLIPTNQKFKNLLIDIFNYHKPKINENSIININHQINNLNIKKDLLVQHSSIYNILQKSEEILRESNINFNYPETQIYRKNEINLDCNRHLGIFNKHDIIPKFCFGCYKVQITLDNVLELIKLYFYFNRINLENNNIRKCMIELRENVSGNYKGYLYAGSINEANNIKKLLQNDLISEKINSNKIEIKHGCTEYYDKYELYKNIDKDIKNNVYQKEWEDIEKKFDQKYLIKENNKEKIFSNTLNKYNLPDFLIIKNWLIYAKLINDDSYKKIFKFDLNTNNLTENERQNISSRTKKIKSIF